MRWGLVATLGVSLAAHGMVATALLMPPWHLLPKAPPTADPPPQNAGETFELPSPELSDLPLANAAPSPDTQAAAAPDEASDAPAAPVPPPRARPASRPSHEGRPSAGRVATARTADGQVGSAGSAAPFGAVGDRSASDLTRAFTRDFPQAASGDPIWRNAPLGPAGEATVVLTLDDDGHIANVQVLGNASGPLAQGIRRTMTLIKNRPFTARSRVTKLRIVGTISADVVHDGLHGDVFAIGAGDDTAFFALNVGRRVDLRVRPVP